LCLTGMLVVYLAKMPAVTEWSVALAGVVASALTFYIALHSDSPWALVSLVTLNVVVVYAMGAGRFWPGALMCLLIAAGQVSVILARSSFSDPLSIATSLLLLSTIVFTLYGSYRLEHSEREAYLLDMQERELQGQLSLANEALAQTARTDSLTEVANRRHFDDFLAQVWQHAQKQRSPISLMLIDVDHFKAYNDHYGHQAGDQCLRAIAQTISACLRKPHDLVARWGGEEFAVVMSGASPDMAQQAAERVRQAVQAQGLLHAASRTADTVTISIGVTWVDPGPETCIQEFVRTADTSLYEAKGRGRNRVWARPTDPFGAHDVDPFSTMKGPVAA
jgi:diguanylate cyclase (GGDEF)-like protein